MRLYETTGLMSAIEDQSPGNFPCHMGDETNADAF